MAKNWFTWIWNFITIFAKIYLSQKLESGAKLLIEKSKTFTQGQEDIISIFLPLIRRTFDTDNFDVNELYNLTLANLNELEERKTAVKNALPNIYRTHLQEIEREFVDKLEKIYIGKNSK